MRNLILCFIALSLLSCNSKDPVKNEPFVEKRTTIKTEPVQVYEEKGNGADTGILKVELFETENSLEYKMISHFRGTNWEFLLAYPNNYDIMPKPKLMKDTVAMSCRVGFLDDEDVFKDYRLVYVKDGKINYRRLKEYQKK